MEGPYGQSNLSMSPSDFFTGLDLQQQQRQQQQQQQQQQQPLLQQAIGPRQYKSRKFRPCDFCRARQVACKIDTAPPCNLCASHNRECTFVEQPKKKRRPNPSLSGDSIPTIHQSHISNGGAIHKHNHSHSHVNVLDPALAGLDHNVPPPHIQHQHQHRHSLQMDNGFMQHYDERVFDPQLLQDQFIDPQIHAFSQSPLQHHYPLLQQEAAPEDYNLRSPDMSVGTGLMDRPLDYQTNRSARFIGETGESNPYLLRHYKYDENDECTISKLTYRRIKRTSQPSVSGKGEPPVVFMLAEDAMASKGEPRIEDDVLGKARQDLSNLFTEEEALHLVGLYFRFVNPYFQILPRSESFINGEVSLLALRTMPTSLLSAIYATALPFMLYDSLLSTTIIHNPPSAAALYRISWLSIVQELHTPRLATLQACLLLLQRAPTNRYTTDTPWKTSLVGWTVSLAQSLGINHSPDDWSSLPTWEVTLRKRLFHGLYIMDKWASLGAGMPSHIRTDDFDVLPLLPSDCENLPLEDSNGMGMPAPGEADAHFRLLSELTAILSDIMDAYYSLRATQRTAKDFPLSLELAWPLRSRLKAWNDSLPPSLGLHSNDKVDIRGMAKLSANPSLSLAYIVATMTLFRALLRPLQNLDEIEEGRDGIEGSVKAAKEGAIQCAREVVEFVEGLGRGALEGFWHSWSRANFAIASSFLMQLHMAATSPEQKSEIGDLVTRWRWAMRIGSGSTGNGLMSLGLLRMDGLLREGENGQDIGHERRNTVC